MLNWELTSTFKIGRFQLYSNSLFFIFWGPTSFWRLMEFQKAVCTWFAELIEVYLSLNIWSRWSFFYNLVHFSVFLSAFEIIYHKEKTKFQFHIGVHVPTTFHVTFWKFSWSNSDSIFTRNYYYLHIGTNISKWMELHENLCKCKFFHAKFQRDGTLYWVYWWYELKYGKKEKTYRFQTIHCKNSTNLNKRFEAQLLLLLF